MAAIRARQAIFISELAVLVGLGAVERAEAIESGRLRNDGLTDKQKTLMARTPELMSDASTGSIRLCSALMPDVVNGCGDLLRRSPLTAASSTPRCRPDIRQRQPRTAPVPEQIDACVPRCAMSTPPVG